MCVCEVTLVVSDSLRYYGLYLGRLFCPWDSPDKNTGVVCHFLLQGIFLIEIEPVFLIFLHWQAGSLPLTLPGKPNSKYAFICLLLFLNWNISALQRCVFAI